MRDDDLVDRMARVELEAEAAAGIKQVAAYRKSVGELSTLQQQRESNAAEHAERIAEAEGS